MESLHKLEDMVEGWLKPLPHLPENWRKWLAENSWWLTLIGVVLSVFALFALFASLSLFTATTSLYGQIVTTAIAQTHGGLWMTSVWISLALMAVTVVIEAIAISPLKAMSKKGWDLLFLSVVIGVVSSLISAVLNIDITSLISAVIGAVIGSYVLFEIRSHFKKA
jgi:uncharacterized membrane protein